MARWAHPLLVVKVVLGGGPPPHTPLAGKPGNQRVRETYRRVVLACRPSRARCGSIPPFISLPFRGVATHRSTLSAG